MQFVINRSSSTIREHYLHSILRGHTIENSLPDEIIHDIDEKMLGPYFCVVVFKINESEQSNGMDVGHQPLLRFALGNITKEMLENIGECDYLIMGKNEAVAVIQYAKNQAPEQLKPALRDIQNFMSRYFKVMVSIGIGDISYGKKNLHYSYTSAQQYVRYRLIYGKESILDTKVTRPHIMTSLSYPSAYEKKLLDAVQSGKPEAIRDAISQFIEQISSGSINQIITCSIQLMLSLLKRFEYLQHVPDSDFNNYLDATADIESAEHLNEIKDIFYRYCFNICELMEEKNNWINAQKHNVEIEKVLNYIQEHYDEPGLSLESVSNIASLSPSYLGKLLKGTTKQSFSEYLNHTRLEKAKDLLASTNDTAAKISESVGIYNITYFSTLFKKKYGLTPSAFREQEAIKRSGSAGKETLNQRQA